MIQCGGAGWEAVLSSRLPGDCRYRNLPHHWADQWHPHPAAAYWSHTNQHWRGSKKIPWVLDQTKRTDRNRWDTFRCCWWTVGIPTLPLCVFQFLVDCVRLSSLPHVTFVLGGTEYSLTAEHYVRKVNPLFLCVGGQTAQKNVFIWYSNMQAMVQHCLSVLRRCLETGRCVSAASRLWTLSPTRALCGFLEMYFWDRSTAFSTEDRTVSALLLRGTEPNNDLLLFRSCVWSINTPK